ncbi:aldolase/citrate lyase family protein [Roseicyclus sp.]|uniref:aldolase/citrate lyase family protein n=1 Tax=Roseicyclus sp. TaxID=1914329 RepID=UPI003F9F68BF
MADLMSRLHGDVPLVAVNPGGLAVPVADALAGQENVAIFIDCERTPVSVSDAAVMARASRGNGLFSILRTESAEPAIVTRYLDCRIDAIVLPQMESAAQCAAVRAVIETHAATAKRTAFIAQIESVEGHLALDDIATTPGIDAILIGPNDLAASMGLPGQPRHADVVAAVDDIATRVRGHGLAFGLPVDASTAAHWAERGARIFYTAIRQFLGEGIGQLRMAKP